MAQVPFQRPDTLFLFKQKRNLSVLFKQTAFLCLKSFNIAPKTRFLA